MDCSHRKLSRIHLPKLPVLLGVIWIVAAGCRTPPGSKESVDPLKVGNTVVSIAVHQNGGTVPTLLNLHDDENTSVTAGRIALHDFPGRLLELQHSGKRLVEFELGGHRYRFDPNRVFSDAGVQATLERTGSYDPEAGRVVRDFARALLKNYDLNRQPVIVALHNTSGRGLAIDSYQPGARLETAAGRVYASSHRAPGDFFYVTDPRFFDYLAARDFNVILQDDATVTDDGSASVYFGALGIPYVNIEADLNHLTEQVEMVRVVLEMLKELQLAPEE